METVLAWSSLQKLMKPSRKYQEFFLIFLIIVFSFAIRVYRIDLPAPYHDESLIPYLSMIFKNKLPDYFTPKIKILDREYPLMIDEYVGATKVYLHSFSSNFIGSFWLHRYLSVLESVLAILFTFLLARLILPFKPSALLALFMALSPTLIFYSRSGTNSFLQALYASIAYFFSVRGIKTSSRKYIYSGFFFLGLAGSERLDQLWPGIAATAYFLIFYRNQLFQKLKNRKIFLLKSLSCFTIGMIPFILMNLLYKFSTITRITRNFPVTQYGHNNLNLIDNFITRIKNTSTFLDGSFFTETGISVSNPLIPSLFFLSLFFLFIYKQKLAKVFFFITFFSLLATTFSPSTGNHPMQLLNLFPFLYFTIIVACYLFPFKKLSYGLLIVAIIIDLSSNMKYYRSLIKTEGVGFYSPAIYSLANYLQTHYPDSQVYYLDWGFSYNLYYILSKPLYGQELFGYTKEASSEIIASWKEAFKNNRNIYLFHASDITRFNRFFQFDSTVQTEGKQLILEKTFFEKDGLTPVYYLYKVQ